MVIVIGCWLLVAGCWLRLLVLVTAVATQTHEELPVASNQQPATIQRGKPAKILVITVSCFATI